MQYQLEHHLFPTIPRYYYASLAPLVKQFANERGWFIVEIVFIAIANVHLYMTDGLYLTIVLK
jgi:fatty acid desaturase